jgi:hypothetical protein
LLGWRHPPEQKLVTVIILSTEMRVYSVWIGQRSA